MGKIVINLPGNNIEERNYIVQTIIGDFLGIDYDILVSDKTTDYIISWNNKRLIIKDDFFNYHKQNLSYLSISNIPASINWFDASPLGLDEVPIIYGSNILHIEKDTIICGLDIFASSFFMLSRWEEVVIVIKDQFGRCSESDMFVVKNNIFKRPIVNEYCDLLLSLLSKLGIKHNVKNRKFEVNITHDIDDLFRYASFRNFIKNIAGDIFHRRSIKVLLTTLYKYILFKRGKIKDPFDTFDELMNLSDQFGFKNSFYFKASLESEYDSTYDIFDPRVKEIIKKIQNRGHEVGFHPSKNTFHNFMQFKIEFKRLKSLDTDIKGGRQHFLLYDMKETLNYWDDIFELEYDSSLGFYDRIGFRCGCCYEYNMFNIIERRILKIKQRPLIVMESAAIVDVLRKSLPFSMMYKDIIGVIDSVFKYKGKFVFLWHNDNFNRYQSLKYRHIYFDIVTYLGNLR